MRGCVCPSFMVVPVETVFSTCLGYLLLVPCYIQHDLLMRPLHEAAMITVLESKDTR